MLEGASYLYGSNILSLPTALLEVLSDVGVYKNIIEH